MNARWLLISCCLSLCGCFSAQPIDDLKYACAAQTDCLSGFVCYEGGCCEQEKVTGLCVDHPCIKEGKDFDKDGFPVCAGDCDDQDPARFPGANEACDGKDNNCNSVVDEGAGVTRYRDRDSDGHGSNLPADEIVICASAANGPNLSTLADDCDDANPKRFGGNPELCDGIDNDCNQQIDDGQTTVFFEDVDGDGYGKNLQTIQACAPPAGYAAQGNDCQDNSPNIHPGAIEQCNGFDDDCDGLQDIAEGVTQAFFPDSDGDGYGRGDGGVTQACSPPANYAANGSDCDDAVATINPAAAESCNARDDNCNGTVDEGVRPFWFKDADADLYGTNVAAGREQSCLAPDASFVARAGDCNDVDAGQSPGVAELCNSFDDNCNGLVDEGVTRPFWRDLDNDRFGDPAVSTQLCVAPTGYVTNPNDCDDNATTGASRYPGAPELCDAADNNCDGLKDNDPRCGPRVDQAEDPAFWAAQRVTGLSPAQTTDAGCLAASQYAIDITHNADTNFKTTGSASIRALGFQTDMFLYTPATRNAGWDLSSQRLNFDVAGDAAAWQPEYRQPLLFFCASNGSWARFEPSATTVTASFSTSSVTIPPNMTPGNGYTYGGGFNWSRVDWIEVHVNSTQAVSTTLWVDNFHFVSQ